MILLAELNFFKLLQVLLLSGIKFVFAPLVSMGYGFDYIQTATVSAIGGILGILFFYFLSKWIVKQYAMYCPYIFSYFSGEKVDKAKKILNCCDKVPKKKFTKKNKMIINLRNKYGLLGIISLTPVLLSIPIGAFLAQKYYPKKSSILVYMSVSVVLWSFFISSIIFLF